MRVVAILASRRVRRFAIQRLSVNARREIHLRIVMAGSAIDRLQLFRMRKFFDRGVDVASHTFLIFVNGVVHDFHIHKERDLLAAALRGQAGIRMAFEAGFFGLGMQELKTKKRKQDQYRPASFHGFISKKRSNVMPHSRGKM